MLEKQEFLESFIIFGRMSLEPSSNDSSLSRFHSLPTLRVVHTESDRVLESLRPIWWSCGFLEKVL